jgi:hypothetical protein
MKMSGFFKRFSHQHQAAADMTTTHEEQQQQRQQQQPISTKPVLKVTVGGSRYSREVCYACLIELPGIFQRIGHSENPQKLKAELQLALGIPLILTQARALRDRRGAMAYEKKLHKRYSKHRIIPHGYARAGSTKYYSPDAAISL